MGESKGGGVPRIPELAGDFELVEELGRGGTSVVYLARDLELGRDVAIKLIRPGYVQDEDALARLVREARTVGRLQHPSIVMLLGARRLRDHGLALILQYVPGITLKQRIESEGPLPFAEVERTLRDLGRALVYAHGQRIVHRDIKPENIYLDENVGVARLADFGLARAWDSDSGLTLPGTTIGTPTYMSPEQVDGADLDGRSDLYSLGLVGYEMVTGRQPWAGEALYSVIYKQKNEELPPMSEVRPDMPDNLRRAIEGATRKGPADRWGGATEFLEELDRGSRLETSVPTDGTDSGARAAAGALSVGPAGDWESHLDAVEAAVSGSGAEPPERAPARPAPNPRAERRRRSRRRRRHLALGAAALTALLVAGFFATTGEEGLDGVRSASRELWTVVSGALGTDRSGTSDAPMAEGSQPPGVDRPGGADGAATGEPGFPTDGSDGPTTTDPATPGAPAAVEILGGNTQAAPAGRDLPLPLVARVLDAGGGPVSGVPVVFDVLAGGGAASPPRATTGDDGTALTRWTLGAGGGSQLLVARVEEVYEAQVAFRASVRAEPPAEGPVPGALNVGGGGAQSGTVGEPLQEPLAVQVVDQDGDPLAGVAVRFVAESGGGSIEPAVVQTNPEGRAEATWVLGDVVGPQAAAATVASLPGGRATFEASAVEPSLAVRPGVAVGGTHSCRLQSSGTVACWGANARGQLGSGAGGSRSVSAPTAQSGPLTRLASGLTHVCGLDPEGRAVCWGDNDSGQLGTGGGATETPTRITSDTRFISLAAGVAHTCGITADGALQCWGANESGQLGDGTRQRRSAPTLVRSEVPFTSVSAGWRHTCALDAQGRAYCWGSGDAGQLGSGEGTTITPTAVAGSRRFLAIAAGNSHTCGLVPDGRVLCWGANGGGQLGDGTTDDADVPREVASEERFASLTAGGVHTCALTADGIAHCWGTNLYGQLGDGTTENRPSPSPVAGSSRFAQIDALGSHTCGRTTGGEVLCWGYNVEGQLGDGTRENRAVPTPVSR